MKFRSFCALAALSCLFQTWRAPGAQPTISSFSPTYGSAGDTVQVFGSGFSSGGLTIKFNNGVTAIIHLVGDRQVNATVPSGAVTGPLCVQTTGNPPYCSLDDFVIVPHGPYITSFSPGYGGVNDLITINGYHLTNTPSSTPPTVKFNGVASTNALANADGTVVNARVPTGAPSGFITVTTVSGTGTSSVPFTVVGPGPYISGFSNYFGAGGSAVYIDGLHFTGATNATFNRQPGSSFFVQSDIRISVNAPANVSTGPIGVNSSSGSYTTSSNFYAPPQITSFSPARGRANTNIVITGLNLLGTTSLTIGGVAASFIAPTTNTTLQATAPANASSGQIILRTPAFSALTSTNFNFQPTVFSFSPNFGSAGTNVTITGANLNEGLSSVTFNVTGASFGTPNFGAVTAIVPSGTATGPLAVTTSNGTFVTSGYFYLPPSITSFTPNAGPVGAPVTVNGQNLLGATNVNFNGTPAQSFVVTNNTSIGAVLIPAGVLTGPLSVMTPGGAASSGRFYGIPAITGFAPYHGLPGTNVTITGVNFLDATTVKFGGATAAPPTVVDNNTIKAVVPTGIQTGQITVIAPGGTALSSSNFLADSSDLSVSVSGIPNPVSVTSNLVYTITVANNGPGAAPNVQLNNTLATFPAPVLLKNATTTQGSLNTNFNPIVAALGALNVGNSATVTLTVAPQKPGLTTNLATVASDYPDPNLTDNTNLTATTVLSLPLLSVRLLTNNNVQVSWPLDLSNYVLQSRSALTTNLLWVTNPPGLIVSNLVIEPVTNPAKFYRLIK